MKKYISTLERNGFEGVDASLEISAKDYGLVWKEYKRAVPEKSIKKGDFLFYFGINTGWIEKDGCNGYTDFDWCSFSPEDFSTDFDCLDFEAVAKTAGMDLDEWIKTPYPLKVSDLTSYYGPENVFGSSYDCFQIV